MVGVLASYRGDMQRDPGCGNERSEEFFGELCVIGRAAVNDVALRQLHLVVEIRPTGQVHDRFDEGFIQWHPDRGEPSNTGLVAQRFSERPTESDPGIFHGVVGVHG